MAFLIYFFVLLVSAASVLFGLDLMNAPLSRTPNVPLGHVEASAKPETVSRPQPAAQKAAKKQTDTREAAKAQADNRALTPVYPASPAAPQAGPAAPQPAAQAVGNTAPGAGSNAAQAQAQPQAQASSADAEKPPVQAAQAQANNQSSQQPQAAADTQQAANHCNVQACSAAYQSFRASDCTYQPYDGPRRVCMRDGTDTVARSHERARQASRPRYRYDDERSVAERRGGRYGPPDFRPWRGDDRELSDVESIVRRLAPDGDDDDVPFAGPYGRYRYSYR